MKMISIQVNGESIQWDEQGSLAELVTAQKVNGKGIALVLNAEVVPRYRWQDIHCQEQDKIEFFSAVAGG
jgi:sulfur carrier protein